MLSDDDKKGTIKAHDLGHKKGRKNSFSTYSEKCYVIKINFSTKINK